MIVKVDLLHFNLYSKIQWAKIENIDFVDTDLIQTADVESNPKPIKIFFVHGEPIHMCNEVGNNDMAITISIFFIPISPHHIQVCPFVDNNFSISHFIGSIFIRVMLFCLSIITSFIGNIF